MESPLESTLYPKITNHIDVVIKMMKQKYPADNYDTVPIVGTVKLHGTHGDILIYHDDNIVLQSRNNANILVASDNAGFATAMAGKRQSILRLRDELRSLWIDHHPNEKVKKDLPVTFAGEWIGENIQKGVAISKLSKRFVIVSMRVNGNWVSDRHYANIEAPEDGIYNVARGGIFDMKLHTSDMDRTITELEALAEDVAACCPFARNFGITGEGEGIVWKMSPWITDSDLWFKTKGGRFKPTFAPLLNPLPKNEKVKREEAATMAKAWCSELRLEQGWDYLAEQGIPQNLQGIGAFLKWIQNDIFVEERLYIEGNKVAHQLLKPEIVAIAKPWFLDRNHGDRKRY